jgi:hypothetical protein
MLVDSMKLAYEAFLAARLGYSKGDVLELFARTLALVRERDAMVVEVPRSWVQDLDPYYHQTIQPNEDSTWCQVSQLSESGRGLLTFIEVCAEELGAMCSSGAPLTAIQSVGYALHPLPELVEGRAGLFEPHQFQFNFRIVAFHWSVIPPNLQVALCYLAGFEPEEVEDLLHQPDFAIDMYPEPKEGD